MIPKRGEDVALAVYNTDELIAEINRRLAEKFKHSGTPIINTPEFEVTMRYKLSDLLKRDV